MVRIFTPCINHQNSYKLQLTHFQTQPFNQDRLNCLGISNSVSSNSVALKLSIHQNHLDSLLKHKIWGSTPSVSNSGGLRQDPRIYSSSKFLSDDDVGLRFKICEPLVEDVSDRGLKAKNLVILYLVCTNSNSRDKFCIAQ